MVDLIYISITGIPAFDFFFSLFANLSLSITAIFGIFVMFSKS